MGVSDRLHDATYRLWIYLLPIPALVFYAICLTACVSNSPGICASTVDKSAKLFCQPSSGKAIDALLASISDSSAENGTSATSSAELIYFALKIYNIGQPGHRRNGVPYADGGRVNHSNTAGKALSILQWLVFVFSALFDAGISSVFKKQGGVIESAGPNQYKMATSNKAPASYTPPPPPLPSPNMPLPPARN
ncbi:uncharacterized protein BDZ99DRAFT_483789 [Mytilinidion resinicola]|uniref:Uncharacterized protein n=1 Tax=Mytilinidion resinicola TaxID=574789 RepID=A0A6A6XXX5_9PEZI|nr:uncharacterized protein BDZ99DRAFT_483789 [Mytilinidion resinicola]KAF2801401.1 hypothetical protein BDZ99DRAFT_483789 [Mytilinidion resinicola]